MERSRWPVTPRLFSLPRNGQLGFFPVFALHALKKHPDSMGLLPVENWPCINLRIDATEGAVHRALELWVHLNADAGRRS